MAVFACPVCKQRGVSFEARSGVLACHMSDCRKWFYPPKEPALLASLEKADFSQSDLDQVQRWLDRKLPDGPPATENRSGSHAVLTN